jgi:hypothetical protein
MNEAIEPSFKATETNQIILTSVDGSIAHFEATRLHITHNEVKAWAKEVKSNRNAKLPECHL